WPAHARCVGQNLLCNVHREGSLKSSRVSTTGRAPRRLGFFPQEIFLDTPHSWALAQRVAQDLLCSAIAPCVSQGARHHHILTRRAVFNILASSTCCRSALITTCQFSTAKLSGPMRTVGIP